MPFAGSLPQLASNCAPVLSLPPRTHRLPDVPAGASAYVEMALIPSELDPKYARACLHLTAILGKEHLLPPPAPALFPSVSPLLGAPSSAGEPVATQPADVGSAAAGGVAAQPISGHTPAPTSAAAAPIAAASSATRAPRLGGVRVKRVDLLPRPRRDILIIDSDTATAAAYPHNTLLLPPHEEGGWDGILPAGFASAASGAAAASPGGSKGPGYLNTPPRVPAAGAEELTVNVHDDLQLAASLVSLYKTAAAQRILQERRQQQAIAQQGSAQQASAQDSQGQGPRSAGGGSAMTPSAASDRVVQRAADIAAWLAYFRQRAVREAAAGSTTPPPVGAAAPPHRHIDSASAPAAAMAPDAARAVAAASSSDALRLLASSRVVLRSVAEIELRHRAAATARPVQSPSAAVQKGDSGAATGATAPPPLK
jgi:hypothetical protein